MNVVQFSRALGEVDDRYILEAVVYGRKHSGWRKWGAWAACLGLILTAAALPGILKGPDNVMPPPVPAPGPVVSDGDKSGGAASIPPPVEQKVTINWDNVVVNESEGLAPDLARLYFDPDIYTEELWGEKEVVAWYGWDLVPGYIPEGLSGSGRGAYAGIVREKATDQIVQDQAGRSFGTDFWEDGSPKSDDDIYIPAGFTVTASRQGILHCALLPVDESKATDFGGTPVTISYCSLPYGPYDRTQKDPSGLHYMPAGYYDIYVASFTLDGVEYEIETTRLELEELIKIVASVINVPPSENFTVGNNQPSLPDRGGEPAEYPDTAIIPGFDLDEPGESAAP